MLLFLLNLSIIIIFILLYFLFKRSDKRWLKINDFLGVVANTVNSVRYGNLATKIVNPAHPSYQALSESINRMVETLNDREKMIIEYQAELTRQNSFLEAVINSLSDGILIIDNDCKILRATPKIADWFGIKENNLLDKNVSDYIVINGASVKKLYNDEIFIKNKPNETFQASSMRLNMEDNKKRFVIIIQDITNQKELENLKEDFVATLTHDLKVPIVAEANMLEFLIGEKFGALSAKQLEALNNMKKSNDELIELVQILLETYKIKKAGVELCKENIMLNEFLANIVEEMLPIAENSGLQIRFNSSRDIRVEADRLQLKRVVKNLIQNAISHSDSSEFVDINVGEIPNFVTISIVDYGKGISKDEIKLIFNKYYSTAKKFRKIGTGLGLYLSKEIINSHNGDIIVKSEESLGTEFLIKLPI